MQYTTLSVAFFAALATAHQHAPQHFHHRRQLNGTSTDSGDQTTLVVTHYSTSTLIQCAATVLDCPARNSASAGAVVTDTIIVATVSNEEDEAISYGTNIAFRLSAQLRKLHLPAPQPSLRTWPLLAPQALLEQFHQRLVLQDTLQQDPVLLPQADH